MKRRNIVIIAILLLILIANLIGCKREQPDSLDTAVREETSNSEIPENTEDNTENEVIEEPVSFECLEEIKTASPESGLVQVDDMLLQYGCKVSDVIDIIADSQSNFDTDDYNESELVPSNYPVLIVYKKNEENYFGIVAENTTQETKSLKDCTVTRIDSYNASKGNVFCAGFNGENNGIVTYDYIKSLMNNYEIIMEASEVDSWEGDVAIRQINLTYSIPSELSIEGILRMEFIFESDTGELKTIKISD